MRTTLSCALALTFLLGGGADAAADPAAGEALRADARPCPPSAVRRLERSARRNGLDGVPAHAVFGGGHGRCYAALPLSSAATAEGGDLPDGVSLALVDLNGEVFLFSSSASPEAVAQAERDYLAGIAPESGNARCRLSSLDGTRETEFACDLQAVKGPVAPDLPADGATVDAGLLVDRDDAAARPVRSVTITVWVEGWGLRVCGSATF